MMTKLIGRTGRVEGREFPITDVLSLGAAADNDARILAEGVSRKHAVVRRDGDAFWIEDARSTNGTFLNGQRIERDRLRHLDVVTLGRDVDLIFVAREGEAESLAPTGVLDASLEMLDGPDGGVIVDVSRGEVSIGRDPSCNVVLDHPAISKVHARIQRTADAVTIEDLRSTNRTYVNGKQITAAVVLGDGDRIELGGIRNLRVRITYGQTAAGAGAPVNAPAFDQEWKTRLVWSDEEMMEIRAALAAPLPAKAPEPAAKPAAAARPAAKVPPKPEAKADKVPPKPEATADKPQAAAKAAPKAEKADVAAPKPEAKAAIAPPSEAKSELTAEAMTAPMKKPLGVISEVRLVGASGTFSVGPGSTTIGRGEKAALRIDNRELSRAHALIVVSPTGVTIEDLGSTNGTFVNGEKIPARRALRDGDRVAFGSVEFAVETRYDRKAG